MSRRDSRSDVLSRNADLAVVGGIVAIAVGVSVLTPTAAVGLPLALLLLFVLPGYVTMAVAYADQGPLVTTSRPMVRVAEQLALSIGLSLAVVPVLGLVTYLSPWSLTEATVVSVVAIYVVLISVLAAVRRSSHTTGSRAESRFGNRVAGSALTIPSPSKMTTTQLLVNGVLVVSVLAATATLGMALLAPPEEAGTTDLHLLTESGDKLVANEYPETVTTGEEAQITVGVTNDEGTRTEYTAVAELQRVRIDGQSVVVVDKTSVGRYQFALEDGNTWRQQLTIEPTLIGENLRFAVYLYRGEAPPRPSSETAYREATLWLDVQPSSEVESG